MDSRNPYTDQDPLKQAMFERLRENCIKPSQEATGRERLMALLVQFCKDNNMEITGDARDGDLVFRLAGDKTARHWWNCAGVGPEGER